MLFNYLRSNGRFHKEHANATLQFTWLAKCEQISMLRFQVRTNVTRPSDWLLGRAAQLLESTRVSVIRNESMPVLLQSSNYVTPQGRAVSIELDRVCLSRCQFGPNTDLPEDLTSMMASPSAWLSTGGTGMLLMISGKGFFEGYGDPSFRGCVDKQTTY